MDGNRFSAFILAAMLALAGAVSAQDDGEERKYANVKTTKVKAISQKLAKQLEPVRTCLAPEGEEGEPVPEPDPRCAEKALSKINTAKLPGHEKAEVWNLYGYTYYLLDDQPKSKVYYLRIINEPEANAPLRNRTLKTVSQISLIEEKYAEALKYYQDWMALQEILGASDYALLATIYYSLDNHNQALTNIEKSIEMMESAGKIGQENWYSLQRSIYYQRGNYPKVVSILKKLIANYQSPRYWRELGGMYGELEVPKDQLAAYQVASLQKKGLTTEPQLMALAYMYMGADVPYKGAEVIIAGIKSGKIKESEKNLRVLGSALYQSGELKKALPWMEKAASKASDGESFARLAGIYVDLERYQDAIRTANEALRRGGVKRRDLTLMTLGTAQFNLQKFDAAIRSFRKIKDDRTIKNRDQWIQYVQNEQKREEQIKASGIDLDRILGRS
ncbi:MAG: hypothetical protein GDA55_03510 [Cellvibrionales bacterium]|nr:hypothetical protein [Cellvibrionales bacterium]